jgi:GNAT superfamily N-acetyltransferase
MSGPKIEFSQTGGSAAEYVRERLDSYNIAETGVSSWYPFNFFLKTERGEVMGGLLGSQWGGICYISHLWVDQQMRGKRWATKLMDEAEAYARERGAHAIMLDTHSFQARPFYEKRGFELLFAIDDWPKGHKKFYLKKTL